MAAGEGLVGPPSSCAESPRGQLWGRQGSHPTLQLLHRGAGLGHLPWAWVTSSPGEIPGADHSGCCGGTSGFSVALPAVGPVVAACQWGAAFKSAADIPEECQGLRLHPEEGLQHPSALRADPPPGALTGSAVFYLLLTCLANNAVELWFLKFLITVVSSVNILEPTLMLERLTLFFFFVIKLYFS